MKNLISGGALALVLAFLLTACAPSGGMVTPTAPVTTSEVTMDKEDEMLPADNTGTKLKKGMDITMIAPDFELKDLAGNTIKLSDFSGENVYIKYWASWCPICLGGLEDINTLSGEDIDFKLLTIVSPGHKGEKNAEDFKTWFSGVENTKNITVLLDEAGTYTTAAGVRGYPTSEWIDGDGNILAIAPGHKDNDMIKAGFADMN